MNKVTALAMTLEPLEYQAAHGALTSVAAIPNGGALDPLMLGSNHAFYKHGLHSGINSNNPSPNDIKESLEESLQALDSHNLAKQNSAALMDRIDTKYLIPKQYLFGILKALSRDYSVLCENNKRIFTYETTYFDTPTKQFYHAHHNGHLNRRKVRFRRYVESNMGFMEVKLKNNKRRTIKKRVPMDCVQANDERVKAFVSQCLAEGEHSQKRLHKDSVTQGLSKDESRLNTSLFVNYRRITLLNKHHQERLTIDLDLHFQCSQSNNRRQLEDLFIVEVKRDAKQQASSFSNVVKQLSLKPINFSKYCLGLALTHGGQLKTNRFKQTLLRVEKLAALAKSAALNNNKYFIGEE